MNKRGAAALIALLLLFAQSPGTALSVDNACPDKRCATLECRGIGDRRHAPQMFPTVYGYNFRLCPDSKTDLEMKYVEGEYTINGIPWKPGVTGKGTLLLGVEELRCVDLAQRIAEANPALERHDFLVDSNVLYYQGINVETGVFKSNYLNGKNIEKRTPYPVVGDLFTVKSSTGSFTFTPKSVLTNKRLLINGKFIR